VPESWIESGGVMLPMYQSEALWLNFTSRYPFLVKVAAGKINAVTGEAWSDEVCRDPQNYLVVPDQPWLDGFCVEKGLIRQFVAMPLGSGYSAEEQVTGAAEHGGIQLVAYPMKAEAYGRWKKRAGRVYGLDMCVSDNLECLESGSMGLAPGGRMKQEIFDDPYPAEDWEPDRSGRCFVHLANSLTWRAITGESPPTVPPTAREYAAAGLPWFDYYDADRKALGGSGILAKLKSVAKLGKEKGDVPLPENESVVVRRVVRLRKGLEPGQVREGSL